MKLLKRLIPAVLMTLFVLPQCGCLQMEALRKENGQLRKLNSELEEQNEKFKTNYYKLLEQKNQLEGEQQKDIKALEAQVKRYRDLKSERETSLEENIRQLNLQHQGKLDEQSGEIKRLNDKIVDLESQVENAKSALAQASNEKAELQKKQTELAGELETAKQALDAKEHELKQYTQVKGDLQQKMDEAQKTAANKDATIDELKKEIVSLNEKIEDLTDDLTSRDERIAHLSKEKNVTDQELKDKKQREAEIAQKIAKLEQANQEQGDAPPEEIAQRKAEIDRLTKELESVRAEMDKSPAELDPDLAKVETALKETLKPQIDAGEVEVLCDRRGVVARISSDVIFEPGSVVIDSKMEGMLKRLGTQLAQFSGNPISIEGHTDNQPVLNLGYPHNLALSAQRSVAVMQFLIEQGGLGEHNNVRSVAWGKLRPIAPNNTPESRSKNRRVEIIVEPKS
ncbi:OmpA family protein [Candidatus Sumerlaeota bacterium]|nr:OmpA family protein [Candidatus Sumerlaeota bacterium]